MRLLCCLCFLFLLAGCGPRIPESGDRLSELQREVDLLRRELDRCYENCDNPLPPMPPTNPDPAYRERGVTVEVLPTDVYFESGRAELTAAGVQKLAEVVARLRRDYPGLDLRVEGYTDSIPIGANLRDVYPSNWELSAARAASVVRHLQATHGFDPMKMEAVGYGMYRNVAPNDTPQGRQQNRRVRIAVYLDR